jgi:predicted phosphodiesterase
MGSFIPVAILVVSLILPACASSNRSVESTVVKPERRGQPFKPEHKDVLRVLLVGDTGHPGDDIKRVRRAMLAEKKDVIVALGDLAYPMVPECPNGRAEGEAKKQLDWKLGEALGGLGAPVLLVMGNHDIPRNVSGSAHEACLVDYAAQHPDFVLPDTTHVVDYGVATLAIANTQNLRDEDGQKIAQALRESKGWRIGLAHHVYKTYRDKTNEDMVRPWLKKHGIELDVWGNGHAHVLQLGLYGGVVAVTSGTASRKREKPTCPPSCGEGELFGSSEAGYALMELSAETISVAFKNADGKELHRWSSSRKTLSNKPAAP